MERWIKERVLDGVLNGTRRNGEAVFHLSQQTNLGYVPVDTGTLKKSGLYEHIADGYMIAYRVNYSSIIERGSPAHTENVKAHSYYSRTRKKRIKVKSFQRFMPKRSGQWFLHRALKEETKYRLIEEVKTSILKQRGFKQA